MSHDPRVGWIDRRVHAAMQSETDALRATIAEVQGAVAATQGQVAELRAVVEAIGVEMGVRAAHIDAGLNAMRDAIDQDERIEALRVRLEGLSAQHRWDTDQLRQSLAAVVERLPLTD